MMEYLRCTDNGLLVSNYFWVDPMLRAKISTHDLPV